VAVGVGVAVEVGVGVAEAVGEIMFGGNVVSGII